MEEVKSVQGMPVVNEVIDPTAERKAEEDKYIADSGKELKEVYYSQDEANAVIAYLGFDLDEEYVYTVPDCFKKLPTEKQAIFKFRVMDGELDQQFIHFIIDNEIKISKDDNLIYHIRTNQKLQKWLLDNVLVGWKNYRDINGKEINYNKDRLGRSLPAILKSDLAEFAYINRFLDEKEKVSLEF